MGAAMVLASATAFGTLAVLAKLGYRTGLLLPQLLAYRFVIAALGLIAVAMVVGQSPLRLGRRAALLAVMGLAYAGQAFTFFTALRTLSASLTELVLYTYPTIVALSGWALWRRPLAPVHWAALPITFIGVGLLVGGVGFRATPALAFAFASPVIYSGYIHLGDRIMTGTSPLAASATTVSVTALLFAFLAATEGRLGPPPSPAAWLDVAALALVPTMLAITLFLAALPRLGAAQAALLSSCEPVVTVALAVAVLGDRLSWIQIVGATLVLGAVVAVQWPPAARKRLGEPLPRFRQE